MKTPREILLRKHRAAEPQLDAAREAALETLRPQQMAASRPGCATFLRELFVLPRPALAGLAAAWAVIVGLNIASKDSVEQQPVAMASRTPASRQAIAEQRRFYIELVRAQMPADVPVFIPRPRSESRPSIATA
jgi:hypothetical protein